MHQQRVAAVDLLVGPHARARQVRTGGADLELVLQPSGAEEIERSMAQRPGRRLGIVERGQDGTLELAFDARALDQLREETAAQARRADRVRIGAALLISGILWLGLRLSPTLVGIILGAAGLGLLLVLWFRRPR